MTSTSESVELQLNQSDVALINEVKESVFKNFEAMHIVPNDGPMFVDLLEGVTL